MQYYSYTYLIAVACYYLRIQRSDGFISNSFEQEQVKRVIS